MRYTVTGFEELFSDIKARGGTVKGPGAVKAVRAGGKVIEAAMKELAPVLDRKTPGSTSLAPGELKESISTRVSEKTGDAVATVGPTGRAAYVGSLVEYGHRNVKGGRSKILANGRTRGPGVASSVDVPPHPWARPAFESSVDDATQVMGATLLESWEKGKV